MLVAGEPLSGTLLARRAGTLRSKVSAEVKEVKVEAGERVDEGAVLVQLDDHALQQQVSAVRLSVRSARRALDVAKLDEVRAFRLWKAGVMSARESEAARRGRWLQHAQLAEALGRLAAIEDQLQSTKVVAPFAGVVSDRLVSVGDMAQPGAALMTVVDPSSLVLEASVPSEHVALLKVGAPAQFKVAGYGDRRFEGRVERIHPAVDPATRQVRLTVALPNDDEGLLAGLVAYGRVATAERRALSLPLAAVDMRGLTPSVLRLRAGKAERVQVELGLRDALAEQVEVRRGLREGDWVVRESASTLAPGANVRLELAPQRAATGRRPPR